MPRKPRTREQRRAEEARRQARARQMGFSSRAAMRTALAQGWTPQRKAGPRSQIVAPPSGEQGRPIPQGLKGLARLRAESAQWSRLHSRIPTSRYDRRWDAETVRRYHAAFIDPNTRSNKIENELYALREFLVDTRGYYTDATFDERYGVNYVNDMVARYESPELTARLKGQSL